MATTIKLKNGSGAPTAGDLVQGEPAIDLTNKRLYTEDSGGSVIEVGSNPSSLSIAGTAVTATATELNTLDGITSTTAELNILDGVTATAAELNVLDGVTAFVDEDDMVSNSATSIPSQQSVKAYVDAQVTASDLDFQGDSGGALSIDLDSETLTIAGGTGIDTSGATNTLTVAIDSTVATLTGTQTLTNKTLTSPIISSISNTGTLTLPTSTDTLVGRATTDTLTNKTLTSAVLNTGVSGTAVLDEDDMSSNSATQLATQQSIKAYVDAQVAGADTLAELTDTNITTPADGALLFYDTTTSKWIDNVVSGDVTIADTGVAAISSGVIVNDDINASAAISVSKTALTAGTGLTLTGDTLSVDASQTQITAVGTIGTGTWQGSVISDTYVANDLTISGGTIENTIIGAATPAAGTFTTFTSTGIDDNATSTAITIDSSENTTFAGTITSGDITVSDATPFIRLQDSDITNAYTQVTNINGNGYIGARNDTADAIFAVGGYGGGTFTEYARWSDTGNLTQRNNLLVQGSFTSLGIDDNATSTAITINSSGNVGIGTTSPSYSLDVSTNTDNAYVARFSQDHATGWGVLIDTDGTVNTDPALWVKNATDTIMWAGQGGNVGIGTTSPSDLLHIKSTSADAEITLETTNTGGDARLRMKASSTGLSSLQFQDENDSNVGFLNYDHSDNSMHFRLNDSEKMRIDSSGNVGIGTTNPVFPLVVSNGNGGTEFEPGDTICKTFTYNRTTSQYADNQIGGKEIIFTSGTTTNTERMRIDSLGNVNVGLSVGTGTGSTILLNNSGVKSGPALNIGGTDTAVTHDDVVGALTFVTADPSYTNTYSDGITGQISSITETGVGGGYGMAFYTGVTTGSDRAERMRISYSGNVGIGTASPGRLLHLESGSSPAIRIKDTSGTGTIHELITSGANGQLLNLLLDAGGAGTNPSFIIKNVGTELMRIDSSGNLLVGKTSASVASIGIQNSPDGRVDISRAGTTAATLVGFFRNGSGSACGSISSTSTTTSYNTSSDQRLKENIVDAPAGNIDAIRVRSFDWKADGTHQPHGMIAQELVDVAPEAVTQGGTDDDMWQVDYSKLVPMMIKEIQDLRARVAQLEGA